jgi:hypothetical protein
VAVETLLVPAVQFLILVLVVAVVVYLMEQIKLHLQILQ